VSAHLESSEEILDAAGELAKLKSTDIEQGLAICGDGGLASLLFNALLAQGFGAASGLILLALVRVLRPATMPASAGVS